MQLNPIRSIRSMRRGARHRALVRDEVHLFQQRFAADAHAMAVEKLARGDLTSRYLAILRDVERALRPQKPGMLARLGLRKA